MPEGVAVEVARAFLGAVLSGRPVPTQLIHQLTEAVLDRDEVRLALEVREGGPHAVRRAIELAALLVAHQGCSVGDPSASGSSEA